MDKTDVVRAASSEEFRLRGAVREADVFGGVVPEASVMFAGAAAKLLKQKRMH